MKQIIESSVTVESHAGLAPPKASQLLAAQTRLSQAAVKDAMQKGAVWLLRGHNKSRLRRNSKALRAGDTLQLNYNAELLAAPVPEPQLLHDAGAYSVWYKPYGMPCQGSRWGDFASINRWVELHFAQSARPRPVFLVHRLDRATTGLLLLAHSKQAARAFSELFRDGAIDKRYQAVVHGDFSAYPRDYAVDQPIDGKASCSLFSFVAGNGRHSLLDVQLLSGRKHQIRRHLSGLGFAIVGDRLYGRAGDTAQDLQLQSVALAFLCPLTGEAQRFSAPPAVMLSLQSSDRG